MKIYFAGSIRAGREDVVLYGQLIEKLKKYGPVLTEHVGDPKITIDGEGYDTEGDKKVWLKDMDFMKQAEVLVAEITIASLGVGYEIAKAEEKSIPVLCLFRPASGKKVSGLIRGCPKATTIEYETIEEAEKIIEKFFKTI